MPTPNDNAAAEFRTELATLLPTLERRALKLCLNRAEANDVVQDTMVRALRFESSYRRGTNMRAWAHQILFSVFVTKCRKRRRERKALTLVANDPCSWPDRAPAPELTSLTPRIAGALDGLPPQFGAVIRLVDLDERSYKEAATMLDVPVGTVMSRLFRGRRLLAQKLSGDLPRAA